MRIIDAHTHAFPEFLVEKALNTVIQLSQGAVVPVHNGTVKGLLNEMDKAGIERSILCSIATKPNQTEGIFAWSTKIRSERIIPLPSVHPENKDIPDILNRIKQEGFRGIKLHAQYQGYAIDSEGYFPVYESAIDNDLIVEFHAGYDISFPLDDSANPERIAFVLNKFPELKAFAAHLGGWKDWSRAYESLAGKNVYFGMSFVLGYIDEELFSKILKKHGADKILFSTDSPWLSQAHEIKKLQDYPLNEKDKKKIFHENAEQFFGLE